MTKVSSISNNCGHLKKKALHSALALKVFYDGTLLLLNSMIMFTFILFLQLVAYHLAGMVEYVKLQIGVFAMWDGLGHHVKLVC